MSPGIIILTCYSAVELGKGKENGKKYTALEEQYIDKHTRTRTCTRMHTQKKNTEEKRKRIDTHLQSQADARIL